MLNNEKAQILRLYHGQVVTGIILNEKTLQEPREKGG